MKKQRKRLLSDPYSKEEDLSSLFENLHLQQNSVQETSINMQAMVEELQQQMATLMATNNALVTKLTQIENAQVALQNASSVTVTEYEDIVPTYTSGDHIQLDAFKAIHDFNGDKKIYRSWRSQVTKMMKQIETFKTHPKYAAALSIIRAKIIGAASDILINNDAAHNIDAIIDRLDFSYSDQRPLYVIESEMTSIKQNQKTLQEYYDDINQALNMVITKIAMSYKESGEQKSLICEAQGKAIRTFVTGVNSSLIRTTLYGSSPKSLSQAFSIAQTIQYDNQHLQLEYHTRDSKKLTKNIVDTKMNFHPNFRYEANASKMTGKQNQTNTWPTKQQSPTPMDIDSSKQNIQKTQYQQHELQALKRQRDPSFQYAHKQNSSFQHVGKQQRINHVNETEDIQSIYDDTNQYDNENFENISSSSEKESTFLEE